MKTDNRVKKKLDLEAFADVFTFISPTYRYPAEYYKPCVLLAKKVMCLGLHTIDRPV